uniref:syntenin-1-like n=1 Tax=Styela clava TaxID=7725 RepID=UPI00193A4223|nr:syntenin-1-like [Styela clava]
MSLYPSLEDMKVDQAIRAQSQHRDDHMLALNMQQQEMAAAGIPPQQAGMPAGHGSYSSLYPSLDEYMGLNLNSSEVQTQLAVIPPQSQAVAVPQASQVPGLVAPVSGQNNLGILRSEVKGGIRQMTVCKDGKGKMGIRIKAVSKGIFVAFVNSGSPCAMAGLRFGDQILQINNETLAGYSTDKVMSLLKKADAKKVEFAIRDRPYSRTVTMQKDSSGHVGFIYKQGKITGLVKDSSAARNGLLIDHNLCEVNGQCVVGMKDKETAEVLSSSPTTMTITIMPTFIFEHIVKSMDFGLLKKHQDHSIPEI